MIHNAHGGKLWPIKRVRFVGAEDWFFADYDENLVGVPGWYYEEGERSFVQLRRGTKIVRAINVTALAEIEFGADAAEDTP